MTLENTIEAVYQSLDNDNEDIDQHIASLKSALVTAGKKEAVFDPDRIPVKNRAGRKMMQSYFAKRGVKVVFSS